MDEGLNAAARSIFERAKGIIINPKAEWTKIEAEQTSERDVLLTYALPLAAIGPVARLLGEQIFGWNAVIVRVPIDLLYSVISAIVGFALSIGLVYAVGVGAHALAPQFGGQTTRTNAVKLAVYSSTVFWIVQIFWIIPMLALFSFLGLYSLYLLFTGISPMLKIPEDKLPTCAVILLIAAAVAYGLILGLPGRITMGLGILPVSISSFT